MTGLTTIKKEKREIEQDVNAATHLLKLVRFIEVGNFATAQYVVDIFQETLLHNLDVREEEHGRNVVHARLPVETAKV